MFREAKEFAQGHPAKKEKKSQGTVGIWIHVLWSLKMDWGLVKPSPSESKANGGQIYLEQVGSKFSLLLKVTFVLKKKHNNLGSSPVA